MREALKKRGVERVPTYLSSTLIRSPPMVADMSSSTASAMDLTLTYYLTKAHLGSLALEPEYNASASIAKAASKDSKLLQIQAQIVNIAKSSALAALNLAISQVGFRDRLIYLPGYYHFVSVCVCVCVCFKDSRCNCLFLIFYVSLSASWSFRRISITTRPTKVPIHAGRGSKRCTGSSRSI